MTLEEEVRYYIAVRLRCWQLAQLERMAARPALAARRKVRPRVGIVRRALRWIAGV